MTGVSKFIFGLIAQSLMQHFKSRGIKLAKIQLARAYIVGVRELRGQFQLLVGIVSCMLLMLAGFLLLVFGLVELLPVGAVARAWVLTATGALAFFGPLILFLRLNSEKNWIQKAHVDEVLDIAVEPESKQRPFMLKPQSALS